jgi:hypothetical protein
MLAVDIENLHPPIRTRGVGCGPFSLCVIHKEGLCSSSREINRLMMMMIENFSLMQEITAKIFKFMLINFDGVS